MSKHWNNFELFFYYEFINNDDFPEEKKELIQIDSSYYFIPQDFTIYQKKDRQSEEITDTDFHKNFFTFYWMLAHLPIGEVENLLTFHYEKYSKEKRHFLQSVYHELKGLKHHQGKVEIPAPQQKIIAIKWCEEKMQDSNFVKPAIKKDEVTISPEGIFFSGQYFDALLKVNSIVSNAKSEIILIDNYVDENILHLLASKNSAVHCKILTLPQSLNSSLNSFILAFNKQYKNLEVKSSNKFHDRFLIIDKNEFFHFGASLKDVGNKGFMFSKIDEDFIKKLLLQEFEKEWR